MYTSSCHVTPVASLQKPTSVMQAHDQTTQCLHNRQWQHSRLEWATSEAVNMTQMLLLVLKSNTDVPTSVLLTRDNEQA